MAQFAVIRFLTTLRYSETSPYAARFANTPQDTIVHEPGWYLASTGRPTPDFDKAQVMTVAGMKRKKNQSYKLSRYKEGTYEIVYFEVPEPK